MDALPLVIAGAAAALAATLAGRWKVLEKMGSPGWKALVPFYGDFELMTGASPKSVGLPIAIAVVAALAVLATVMYGGETAVVIWFGYFMLSCVMAVALATSFGEPWWFALGLSLLPFVFYPVLGFGYAEYDEEAFEERGLF